jgi:hypothetical protein
MAEHKNNCYPIEGVVFAKPQRIVPNKKEGEEPYIFNSVILEISEASKGKTYTTMPEFQLGRNVDIDDYAIGDLVKITFSLSGKKISDSWHKSEIKALYIAHADIQGNDTREVNSMVYTPDKKVSEVFVAPNPLDDDNTDDLPF